MSELFDLRQSFFKEAFSLGLEYEAYLATGSQAEQEKFRAYAAKLPQSEQLESCAGQWKRTLHCLVFSGTWCGDCARQCPMLHEIASKSSFVSLRFLDNREHSRFADEVRIHGASRVPTVVLLSEDFFELARFGDRTYSHYRRKFEQERGAACDAGLALSPAEELGEELDEWVRIFDRSQCLLALSPLLRQRYGD